MTTEEIKEYLEIIEDLETNVYAQDIAIEEMQKRISSLGQGKAIATPSRPAKRHIGNYPLAILISVIVAVVLGIVFQNIWFAIIPFLLWNLGLLAEYHDFDRKIMGRTEAEAYYRQQCDTYENAVEADKKRVEQENRQKEVLRSCLAKLQKQHQSTKKSLANIYDVGVLFPKYRNFVAVSSFYEYIASGRCDALTGRDGAYNIFEDELRKDIIILQLSQIISQLEQIRENQFMLYSAIKEGNSISSQLLNSVDQLSNHLASLTLSTPELEGKIEELQQTSKLIEYNTERTQKELAYMNRMAFFRGDYDSLGIWRRRPPSM